MIRFSDKIRMETVYQMVASHNLVLVTDYVGGGVIMTREEREAELEKLRRRQAARDKARREAATNATLLPFRRLRRINARRRPVAPDPHIAD